MPFAEFCGWRYLESREPFGDRRIDHAVGILASTIANVMLRPKSPYKISDFISDWDDMAEVRKAQEIAEKWQAFEMMYEQERLSNGTVN